MIQQHNSSNPSKVKPPGDTKCSDSTNYFNLLSYIKEEMLNGREERQVSISSTVLFRYHSGVIREWYK